MRINRTSLAWWFHSTSSLSVLTTILMVGFPAFGQSKPDNDRAQQLEQLVEALANRNEPPRIAKDSFAIGITSDPPIFGENYDWAEYRRVRKAINILVKRNGEELWPHLVKHLDDRRYALTCSIDDFGVNLTVGDFCQDMVKRNFAGPYGELWSNVSVRPGYTGVIHRAWWPTLDEWSRSWKDKRLWELQVELGEWGVRWLERRETPVEPLGRMNQTRPEAGLGGGMMGGMLGRRPVEMGKQDSEKAGSLQEVPLELEGRGPRGTVSSQNTPVEQEKKRAELISKTKAIIDGIRQTKKPIVGNYFLPFSGVAHYFTEQEAKKIREEYLVRISIGAIPTSATKSDTSESYYLGKTLDEWTTLTKHKDGKVRVDAARALLKMRPASKSTIQLLTQLLEDKEPPVRRSAALALEAVTSRINSGAEVEIVIPALKRLLSDKDSKVRLAAASSLWWIDSEAEPTVRALTELLSDRACGVRAGAASVLGMMGRKAKPAIPALVRLLKDENEEVRIAALDTLAGMGCEAKTAIPTLVELLKDRDENVRWGAARCLESIGYEAKPATPLLIELLSDEDKHVRDAAADALGAIGPAAKAAVPVLAQLLKDGDWPIRRVAAIALGKMGPEAGAAIPALMELLKATDWIERYEAASALGKIGPEAKPAVPALEALLKDENEGIRKAARDALDSIGHNKGK